MQRITEVPIHRSLQCPMRGLLMVCLSYFFLVDMSTIIQIQIMETHVIIISSSNKSQDVISF